MDGRVTPILGFLKKLTDERPYVRLYHSPSWDPKLPETRAAFVSILTKASDDPKRGGRQSSCGYGQSDVHVA